MNSSRQMKIHISRNFEEAAEYDIHQQLEMTVEERQTAAKRLKERVWGLNPPDVKEFHKK